MSLMGLAVAPSAANACASLASVKSFHGKAQFMNFSETASGQDAGGGGNTTIDLDRIATSLQVDLTLGQVHSALAFYYDHKVEMDIDIAERRQRVEALRAAQGESPGRRRLRERGLLP